EVRTQLVDDLRRPRLRADRLGPEGTQLADEGRLVPAEGDANEPGFGGRDEEPADGRGDGAVVDGMGHRRRLAIDAIERCEGTTVRGGLALAGLGFEPAREAGGGGRVVEQHGDQRLVMLLHRAPPRAARSFFTAWYTFARAVTSVPPTLAAISA